MPIKLLKQRHGYRGSDAWFVATAVLALIAIFFLTLLVAALELRWDVLPADTGVITSGDFAM